MPLRKEPPLTRYVLLAAAAAALAVPAAPASAACTTTPHGGVAGENVVSLCNRRVWEKQQYYVYYCTDKNLDGTPEACHEKTIIEFYG